METELIVCGVFFFSVWCISLTLLFVMFVSSFCCNDDEDMENDSNHSIDEIIDDLLNWRDLANLEYNNHLYNEEIIGNLMNSDNRVTIIQL